MMGTYTFIRLNYVVCVTFMTPFILIMLKYLGITGYDVVQERILDTIIGSTISFAASYFIFPSWEFEQIKESLRDVLHANLNYLVRIGDTIAGKEVNVIEYKLARKEVFVQSANLSSTFQRMTSEPKSKQRRIKDVHKFVVLNHILSSYTAMIAAGMAGKPARKAYSEGVRSLKKSINLLNDTGKKLGMVCVDFKADKQLNEEPNASKAEANSDDNLLKDQLDFINKISVDIAKVTENVVFADSIEEGLS